MRELEHIVERAVLLSDGEVLTIDVPSDGESGNGARAATRGSSSVTLEEAEREHIRRTLQMTAGRVAGKGGAAEALGVPESTLRSRMKKLGLR